MSMKLKKHNPTLDTLVLAVSLLRSGYPEAASKQLIAAATTPTFKKDLKVLEAGLRKSVEASDDGDMDEKDWPKKMNDEDIEEDAGGCSKSKKVMARKKDKRGGKLTVAELIASNLKKVND